MEEEWTWEIGEVWESGRSGKRGNCGHGVLSERINNNHNNSKTIWDVLT